MSDYYYCHADGRHWEFPAESAWTAIVKAIGDDEADSLPLHDTVWRIDLAHDLDFSDVEDDEGDVLGRLYRVPGLLWSPEEGCNHEGDDVPWCPICDREAQQ